MDIDLLKLTLTNALSSLDDVGWKRMFGCDAAFRDGNIFALVWKEGRLGLKFPCEEEFDSRISRDGSARWAPGGRTTKHWVLLPDSVVTDAGELQEWVQMAHSLT